MISASTLVLTGVFLYFLVGACIGGGMLIFSHAWGPIRADDVLFAVLLFLAWPLMYMLRTGPGAVILLFVLGIGVAGSLTWLLSLLIL